MRRILSPFLRTPRLTLLIVLLSLATSLPLSAQQNMFVILEYMKTTPGKEWHYVELETNFWKQIHQERVKEGEIVAWLLYHVRYTATNDPYNYVTVTVFADPAKLENPWTVDPIKVHPDKDVEAIYLDTEQSRDLVIRGLMMRQNYIDVPQGAPEPKFIQIDYMKVAPGMDGKYLSLENDVWKPVHQEFIKAGTRAGWSLWGRVYPSGYGLDYQYVTVNDFSDFSQIGKADYMSAFQNAHNGKDVDKLMKETNEDRELVKSELWELLDAAY